MGKYVSKEQKDAGKKVTFNPTVPMQRLIDCCLELGFTLRENYECCDRCSMTHKELGVKFTVDQSYTPPYNGGASQIGKYSLNIVAKIKSTHNTWVVSDQNWKERWVQWEVPHQGAKGVSKPKNTWHGWRKPDEKQMLEIIGDIPKFRGATSKERENKNKIAKLYDPLPLDADYLQDCTVDITVDGKNTKQKGLGLRHFFVNVAVLGFAVINEDLYINTVDANQPDADTWFHLATTTLTAHPHILVRERQDGIFEYYPARRAGKRYRISKNTTPKGTYIDFTKVTKLDAILIEAAIQKYLGSM